MLLRPRLTKFGEFCGNKLLPALLLTAAVAFVGVNLYFIALRWQAITRHKAELAKAAYLLTVDGRKYWTDAVRYEHGGVRFVDRGDRRERWLPIAPGDVVEKQH